MSVALYSIDAEQSVLGSLMLSSDTLDAIGALSAEDFYRDDHREIFRAVRRLSAAGKPVDVVSLFDALEHAGLAEQCGGLSYLGEMANAVPSTAVAGRHAEIIQERALLRRIIATAGEVQDCAIRPDLSAIEKLDHAQASFASIADKGSAKVEPQAMADVLVRHIDRLERRAEGTERGISTGFPDLDDRMSGGMRAGQLILLAARPAMGKTSLALEIAAHCATSGVPTLFCSQEMEESDLADRILSLQSRVSMGKIVGGQLSDEDWSRASHAMSVLQNAPLYLDEQPALTLMDVRNKARQVKRRAGRLGAVFVDYLQLMTGEGANRNSEIEQISRGLKQMAKEMKVPVVALSQLNRGLEQRPNKRPMMSDLRDSGAIEQDADIIMSIYRDEVYNPDSQYAGCAEIGMLKVRQGKSGGFVPMTFVGEYARFESFSGAWAQASEGRSQRKRLGAYD